MPLLFILLLGVTLAGCQPARQTVSLHTLPNYTVHSDHQLLFLDFVISQPRPGQPERVGLANAIVGQGQLKKWRQGTVSSPHQIRLLRMYTDGRLPESDTLEHPLFRSVEVADAATSTLSRSQISERTGHLSIRFPYVTALTRLDVYSVTPANSNQHLFTIRLKP